MQKIGEEHPEVGANALVTSDNFGNIVYQAHVQNIGWKNKLQMEKMQELSEKILELKE